MSKIKEYVRHLAVVAAATLLAQCAWAESTTSKVISFNFSDLTEKNATDTSGIVNVAAEAWNNFSSSGRTRTGDLNMWDGSASVNAGSNFSITWSGSGWWYNSATETILNRYLDDGKATTVTVSNIPFAAYDVYIYCATDTGNAKFAPWTVNGVTYGSPNWGNTNSRAACVIDENTIKVAKQTGTLTIVGSGKVNNSTRGTLAAIQIVEAEAVIVNENVGSAYTATEAEALEGDIFNLTFDAGATLTLDKDLTRNYSLISEGAITLAGDHVTAANLAKLGISGVTGGVTATFDSASIPEGLAFPTAGWTYVYAGTTALSSLPFATTQYTGNAGTIRIACPISSESVIGVMNNKNYVFAEGFSMTADKFVNGNKTVNGDPRPAQSFVQEAGTITLNATYTGNESTTDMPLLFAHWPSDVTYTLQGGSIECPNGNIMLGRDGSVNLTVGGGTSSATLKAPGIKENGRSNAATITIAENGVVEVASLQLGTTKKLAFAGGTLKLTDSGTVTSGQINVSANTTIDVAEGKTVNLSAVLTGTGDVIKTGAGTLNISQVPSNYTGAIKINAGALDVGSNRELQNVQFAEGTTIIITESISDDGTINVTGITGTPAIKIQTANGEEISEETGAVITSGDGWVKAVFTPSVTGKVAMFDFPFDGNLTSVGWDTRTLSKDQGPYYNEDNTAVLAYTRPWNGIQLNAPFSAAIYGTVPSKANTCLISFGSSSDNIFLASGPNANEVVLISVVGGVATELTKMTVPSAATIKHLYSFTLSADKKVVDIYLDGVPNIQYTLTTALSMGAGIQVSGWFGGTVSGYNRCDTAADGGTIDELLVYGAPLKANAMSRLSTIFPYASEKGLYQRAMSASGSWSSEGAWTKHGEEGAFDAPAAGAMAEISVSAAEAITLSLDSENDIETESLKISGSAVKIVKGSNTGVLKNLGATTIQAPVEVEYDAAELLGPLSITGEGSINFDFSAYPVASVLGAKTVQVTGLAKGLEGKVTATLPTDLAGRTMTFGLDAANTYVMTIGFAREACELYIEGDVTITDSTVYADSDGNETVRFYDEDWIVVESEQTLTIGEDLTHPAKIKVVDGGILKLNFASDVTQTDFMYNATVRVEEGGVYDIANANGHKDYSHPIVLAGGKLTNSGIATTVDARQYWQNSVVATSTIDVSGNEFGAVKSGHAAHDYNLGGNVLTKTGAGQFTFKTANFVGGGTLAVEEGTFVLDNCTVPEGATLDFVVASEATIIVKGNQLAKTGTVTGSGTVIYENGVDTSAIYQDTGWTGMLWIKGMNWNDWDLGREGTAGSSQVKLTGFTGYAPNNTTAGCNATVELADEGNTKALSVNNGYSTGAFFFKKIIGSGTFTATSENTSKHVYKFHDVSEFTGKLEANNIRIVVGNGNVGDDAGTMAFTDGIVINGGLNWSAAKVTFGETLKVKGSVGDAIVTVPAAAVPSTMPAVTLLDADGQPVEGEYTLEADGNTLKVVAVQVGPEPIDPTQPKTYDTDAEATAAAEAINANKTELIVKPFETMTDTQKAVYDALVTAKVVGNAVVVDFSESGETTARDSADNALEAADILDTEKTAATVEAIPGLYYAIIGGTDVSAITTSGAAVQAVDTKVTLEKPNLGTTNSGFYKVQVSVTAPAN